MTIEYSLLVTYKFYMWLKVNGDNKQNMWPLVVNGHTLIAYVAKSLYMWSHLRGLCDHKALFYNHLKIFMYG